MLRMRDVQGNYRAMEVVATLAALAFVGLRQQRGGALEFANAPNMLGPFFGAFLGLHRWRFGYYLVSARRKQ